MKMSVKGLMSNSFRIAWKDLMELFRNRLGLVMLVLMPIFMMGMVGYIFPSNNSLNHISIGLANQDAGYVVHAGQYFETLSYGNEILSQLQADDQVKLSEGSLIREKRVWTTERIMLQLCFQRTSPRYYS
jgi:hypothetical protein